MENPVTSITCESRGRKIKLGRFQPEWAQVCAFGDSCVAWSVQGTRSIDIQQVVPLDEIAQRFAPNWTGEACRMVQQNLSQGYEKVQYGKWTVISVSAQGNVGGWIVCQNRNGVQAIVLYCGWWVDKDDLYAGHRPLTATEWEQLMQQ